MAATAGVKRSARGLFLLMAILAACRLSAQPDQAIRQMVVMITLPPAAVGTGVIVAFGDNSIDIVTAKHVAEVSTQVQIHADLHWRRDAGGRSQGKDELTCQVVRKDEVKDLALLRCNVSDVEPRLLRHKIDLVSAPRDIRRSSRLTFIGNVQTRWFSPSTWGSVSGRAGEHILVANTFGMDVSGASGGPLLTSDGLVAGLITSYDADAAHILVLPWNTVDEWIRKDTMPLLRMTSRAPVGLDDTEIAVSYQNFGFPFFSTISAPQVRISRRLPHLGQSIVAFDFAVAGNPNLDQNHIRALRLTIPTFSYEYQLGQALPVIRRNRFLSGIYVASGLGFAVEDSQESGGGVFQSENVRSWAGVFELGARYRWPGRSWGFQGNYREYVLTDQGPGVIYPRFRSYGAGLFVTLR